VLQPRRARKCAPRCTMHFEPRGRLRLFPLPASKRLEQETEPGAPSSLPRPRERGSRWRRRSRAEGGLFEVPPGRLAPMRFAVISSSSRSRAGGPKSQVGAVSRRPLRRIRRAARRPESRSFVCSRPADRSAARLARSSPRANYVRSLPAGSFCMAPSDGRSFYERAEGVRNSPPLARAAREASSHRS
jgi:hypothetical protein